VPVVLTGAMRPADAADADGPRNLADAIALAAGAAPVRGVVVAFAGGVYAARGVRKVHTRRLDAFAGREVAGGAARHEPSLIEPSHLPEAIADWPWVETVTSGAAQTGRAVDALVTAGVQGLVVACTGNGTLHLASRPHSSAPSPAASPSCARRASPRAGSRSRTPARRGSRRPATWRRRRRGSS
jgi:L-asparaginase